MIALRRIISLLVLGLTVPVGAGVITVHSAKAPAAFGPVPTKSQLAWQDTACTMYLRFGMTTFTGHESTGAEDAKLFDPKTIDVKQWVQVAKDAGLGRIVFCAKDHDGFCMWPSKYTDYSVKKSPWKEGKGDLVKELTDACNEAGIQVGIYLSAEDRNNKTVGTSDYDTYYTNQLKELLYNYGAIAEIRFDGAGGESSGALPSFAKDAQAVTVPYNWKSYFALARALQPHAILVSNLGPDARWNGNNIGHCGEPNWATFDPSKIPALLLNDKSQLSYLNSGDPAPAGKIWCPAETFIRDRSTDWYFRAGDDGQLLALDKLVNAYCKSAGRNCVFMLNVPINDKGVIPDADVKLLKDFHATIEGMFKTNLLAGKKVTASNFRANDQAYAAELAIDGDASTYWATDDGVGNESSLEVDLGKPTQFDMASVSEFIPLGQRVETYRIEIPDGAKWKAIVNGKGIGHRKIERFAAVTASKVRLVIEKTRACPTIAEFALYKNVVQTATTPKGNP